MPDTPTIRELRHGLTFSRFLGGSSAPGQSTEIKSLIYDSTSPIQATIPSDSQVLRTADR
jgi:hypothetical protein